MKIILPHQRIWKKERNYVKKILLYDKDIKGKIGQILMAKFKPGSKKEPHWHKIQTEIFFVLSGGAKIIINGEEFRCYPGEIIICEPNEIHEVINDTNQDFRILVLKINPKKQDIYFLSDQESEKRT